VSKRDELLKRLLATFKDEAAEHVQSISSGLVNLEKGPDSEEKAAIVETIYRDAHSLKGAARAVSLPNIETLCSSLEDVFAGFKKDTVETSPELFDALHRAIDAVGELALGSGNVEELDVSALVRSFSGLVEGTVEELESPQAVVKPPEECPVASDAPSASGRNRRDDKAELVPPAQAATRDEPTRQGDSSLTAAKRSASTTVRIATERLDALLLQAEEMLSAKLAAKRRASELLETAATLDVWTKQWTKIQPETRNVGRILDKENGPQKGWRNGSGAAVGKLLDFLEWNHAHVDSLKNDLAALAKSADADARILDRMVEDLLGDMKQILMLPFSSLLDVFPKMIRDLSRDRGKEISLVLEGAEVKIDKRILDDLRDPLIHLLRNSVDHGIEEPGKREQAGKARCGRVSVAIAQIDGSKVEILVSDDGAGMDLDSVKKAALKAGLASEEEAGAADLQGLLGLVCRSGVTTSPIITDISGRGLGLAIVRERVEKLGGTVSLDMQPGAGTSFRILLPLTLSAFRGVLVQAGDQVFIAPTANVERVLRVKLEEVTTIENKEAIELNGEAVSLVRLDDTLGLTRQQDKDSEFVTLVVLSSSGQHIAFAVDSVMGEQEVLLKKLGLQLPRVRNIAGATIRSSGEVIPILSVSDLLKSAVRVSARVAGGAEAGGTDTGTAQSILIAEDSITSRMLLKNILESAGYAVTTAVDGVDALTMLKTQNVDLVVSDIQMPRMDGFELTMKIRGEEKLSALPVVLVTSLSSREDRERGVDAGADAYIIKSSFDQNDLLETIERLI